MMNNGGALCSIFATSAVVHQTVARLVLSIGFGSGFSLIKI